MATNPLGWVPSIKDKRPYFEAKLKKGAIASVAQMTGTPSRTTLATGNLTATQISEYLMAPRARPANSGCHPVRTRGGVAHGSPHSCQGI